jgi:hypothetical protein
MDDNIRAPDSVINEQLIQEDNRSPYDNEIEEAIYLSLQESRSSSVLNEENDKYEEELIQQYKKETEERKNQFAKLLFEMNRLSRIDKEVKEVYEIVEPIIESYCNQMIEVCELDHKTYEKIFNIISKIRINTQNIELLKSIILKTEEQIL